MVSLDPNVRPGLIADWVAYLDRFEGWLRLVDVLKVSEEDLAWLYPRRSADDVVAAWHAAGIPLVLVTRGEHGARASTPFGSASVEAPRVAVVDTVGAGDAFMSGALAHLHERACCPGMACGPWTSRASPSCCRLPVWSLTPVRGPGQSRRRRRAGRRLKDAPREVTLSFGDLVERASSAGSARPAAPAWHHRGTGRRKSKVAREMVDELGPGLAVLVPMDGFHPSNQTLIAWGRRGRKGAWDTFDADGYVNLPAPPAPKPTGGDRARLDFDRDVDQSIGSALPIRREVPLVVTEGNYLLCDWGGWAGVAPLLDESWYLQVDDATTAAADLPSSSPRNEPPRG